MLPKVRHEPMRANVIETEVTRVKGRYFDVLIITENDAEADDINALGNGTIYAIPFGSTLYHGRRYKRIVNAYERKDTEYERIYTNMVACNLRK